MGQEIRQSHFRKQDFDQFEARLRAETELLSHYFNQQGFADGACIGGFELEAWLVDAQGQALAENHRFLDTLNNALVVPELARFNVELNSHPQTLEGSALSHMHQELAHTWDQCQRVAQGMDATLMMIGILPTVREQELVLDNISDMTRYRALNEQLLRLRQGTPLRLEVQGREYLKTYHQDVMLESAATSFQLHLQVPQALAVRAYNASIIISAPVLAACSNSPFLFGHELWDETRIALFEQAISVNSDDVCSMPRVTFGTAYARDSLFECFAENLERYPVLLPEQLDPDAKRFSHLRLHNGTIWRWNRPLIGFNADGTPHLRIEHRVLPAGPTVIDSIANAAFYFGLSCAMIKAAKAPEGLLPFAQARANFYAVARQGVDAHVQWLQGREIAVRDLILDELLPLARTGLLTQGMANEDIELYLGIIDARVQSGQNGTQWQRAYVAKHGRDMAALTLAYRDQQMEGKPVHEWDI